MNIKVIGAMMLAFALSGADVVESDSGYVRSVRYFSHDGLTHTVVHFEITSSATPIHSVIWLYNDEHRLKAGDHVRLETREYGTDAGRRAEQCVVRPPEEEPCSLREVASIQALKDGEY